MDYRRDIDGLRALAVLPVVFYHTDFSAFSGGFVGVDIFFVISGFLITSLIHPEIEKGEFSIIRFYERRVRRIFPALFAVLLACCVAATALFMPQHFKDFSQSLVAATLFASNFLFWNEAGYFDAPAEFKPLLHTWSLAVEEQFYIVFPPLLWALITFARKQCKTLILGALLLSFGFSIWSVQASPDAAFFLPASRAWELLLGAALALGYLPPLQSRTSREVLAAAGLLFITVPVFVYSHDTPFPGAAALLPCLGTAALIHARAPGDSRVAGFLHWQPVVQVGLLSYSLYLWHWPLYVFLKYYRLGELSLHDRVGVIALSLILSVLSLKFIEAPFRRRRLLPRRNGLFRAAGVSMAAAIVFGVAGHVTLGWPQRLPDEVFRLAAYQDSVNPDRDRCHASKKNLIGPGEACQFGPPGEPAIAVWGDSHASVFVPALARHFEALDQRLIHLSFSGCTPAPRYTRTTPDVDPHCAQFNDRVFDYLRRSPSIRKVFIVARWPRLPLEPSGDMQEKRQRLQLLAAALDEVVEALLASGKEVGIFYPVPEVSKPTPSFLARMAIFGKEPGTFTTSWEDHRRLHEWAFTAIDALTRDPRVSGIRPDEILCSSGECRTYAGRHVLYFDDNHLTREGAQLVVEGSQANL